MHINDIVNHPRLPAIIWDFMSRVDSTPTERGCRLWIGNSDRYGDFSIDGEVFSAHRVSQVLFVDRSSTISMCCTDATFRCACIRRTFSSEPRQTTMLTKRRKGEAPEAPEMAQRRSARAPCSRSSPPLAVIKMSRRGSVWRKQPSATSRPAASGRQLPACCLPSEPGCLCQF